MNERGNSKESHLYVCLASFLVNKSDYHFTHCIYTLYLPTQCIYTVYPHNIYLHTVSTQYLHTIYRRVLQCGRMTPTPRTSSCRHPIPPLSMGEILFLLLCIIYFYKSDEPHYCSKRSAEAQQLVTYPNGAVAPYDPNVAIATAQHYAAKAAHGRSVFTLYHNIRHINIYDFIYNISNVCL